MGVESVVSLILEGKDEGMSDVLGDVDSGIAGVVGSLGAIAGVAGVGAVLLGIGSALSEMADMAGDANNALSDVQIRTGATNDEMADLRDTVFDIRDSGLGENFETTAQAMATVQTITKATDEELETMTEKGLLLADVYQYDVQESIRAVDTAMENFNTTSDETFDLIVRGYQETGDPAGDLLDTINEYSADFAEAGFGADEFFGILVAGAEAGAFNLDKVADSVREFTTRIIDGSAPTREALDIIGLGADNMYAGFQDGSITTSDAMGMVIDKLEAMDDKVAQDAAGVALFGSMWEDLGKDVIFALDNGVGALGEYKNASDEAFAVATDGAVATQKQVEAAKETYQILIGEAILPLKAEYYELANAILGAAVEHQRNTEAAEGEIAAKEELYDAGADYIEQLQETATRVGTLRTVQSDLADGYYSSQEAVMAINEIFPPFSENMQVAENNYRALAAANQLLEQGFSGTGQELAQLAADYILIEAVTYEYGATLEDYTSQEAYAALAIRDRALSTEEAIPIVDDNALAAERAALAAERDAEAEAYRAEMVDLSREAIAGLNAEMASGYDASIGILERGDELASLNDVIRESASAAGFSALELAIMDVAIGDTSDEAVQAALKFEIMGQGIKSMAEAAAEDGVVTQQEIQGIISGAQDLQTQLDEAFVFSFEEDGMDGVLTTAGEQIATLEGMVSEPYTLTIAAETKDVTKAVDDAIDASKGLTDVEHIAEFFANTEDADSGVSDLTAQVSDLVTPKYDVLMDSNAPEVQTDVYGLEESLIGTVAPTYNVVMGSNAPAVKGDVDNLRSALDGLNGKTYTFNVVADTSGVPDWAVPHSPLPIHTAWMAFAEDMAGLNIRPNLGGNGLAGSSTIDPRLTAVSTTPSLVIHGDIIMAQPEANPASAAFVAFLQEYLREKERSEF